MNTIEFTLPEKTILLNEWQRLHWMARRSHAEQLSMLVLATMSRARIQRPLRPIARCRVEITRGSSALPDWDGLYGGLKPLLDTFVRPSRRNPHGLGLIEDDNPKCIATLSARPEKAKRGESYTHVLIEEMPV